MRLSILSLFLFIATSSQAVSVNIIVSQQPVCTYANGGLYASASGGVGPYTYLWSTGATTQSISGLLPGTYSVTVTDFALEEATAERVLDPTSNLGYFSDWLNYGNGLCNPYTQLGLDPVVEMPGPGPYFIDGQQMDTLWFLDPNDPWGPEVGLLMAPYFPPQYGQWYNLTITDGTVALVRFSTQIGWPVEWPTITVHEIVGACEGTISGSITFTMSAEGHGQPVQGIIDPAPQGGSVQYFGGGGQPTTHTISGLVAGEYTLMQFMTMSGFLPSSGCNDLFTFTVPDLGPTCGLVSGQVFIDGNQNCLQNGGEAWLPGTILEIQPGPHYLTTASNGSFQKLLPFGDYTVEQQSANFEEHCVGTPIPFTLAVGAPNASVAIADTSLVPLDAMVAISSGSARPGFAFNYGLQVRNLTPTGTGNTTVTFTVDPTLIYSSATPTPSSVNGNVLTWNQSTLGAWQQRSYTIRTMVPPDINLLGTELNATASLVTTTTDGNQANNTATNLRTITGAYDPNDKLAYTSSGSTEVWDVNADEWIDYTIRFQNTGTDTAFTVLITDSLPETLDPGSIIVGAASHNFTWELRDQGTLKFYFQNILLPDSNVNEPRSHGFVGFRIKPHEPVLPGSTIENTANIYFDFNPPVITEPSVLVAEFSTGIPDAKASSTYVAYPVPAAGRIFLSNVTSGNSTNGWSILQVDGRVIRSSNSAFPSNGVDVSDLADGNYLLQVNSVPMPVTIRFAKSH
jgi:uncharacterized repeat protein (TIGR01451 family)